MKENGVSVLVVGLGNADMTPDAVGPGTVRRLTVTRHLKGYDEALFASLNCCELSAFIPGVMGQTGLESVELVKAAARLTRPDLVVAAQRLAAANPNVTAHVYDIRHFETLKDRYHVMSVPCMVINDDMVLFGKKNMAQILDLLTE